MSWVIEIRSYNLKPGTRAQYHALVETQAMPLLKRWQMDVVAYGASLGDEDLYYLIRAFASVDDLEAQEDAFYGSAEWREGPREAILALIEHYTSIVIAVDEITLQGLRR